MTLLRRWLAEPRLEGVDVDDPLLIERHREILRSKPLTRRVFIEIYRAMLAADSRHLRGGGKRLEIGAGSSFLSSIASDVIESDIKPAPGIDMVVDALDMPFAAGEIRTIFAIHTFHHLPDPARFFSELTRVLAPGGGCILVEPYHGPLASLMYRRLFSTEGFDPTQADWTTPATGPMRGANQALSFVVLERDRAEVVRRFPQLQIVEQEPLSNWLRYLLSGGVNFRTLAPTWSDPLLRAVERAASPLARALALHQLIVLRRR